MSQLVPFLNFGLEYPEFADEGDFFNYNFNQKNKMVS